MEKLSFGCNGELENLHPSPTPKYLRNGLGEILKTKSETLNKFETINPKQVSWLVRFNFYLGFKY